RAHFFVAKIAASSLCTNGFRALPGSLLSIRRRTLSSADGDASRPRPQVRQARATATGRGRGVWRTCGAGDRAREVSSAPHAFGHRATQAEFPGTRTGPTVLYSEAAGDQPAVAPHRECRP